MTEKEKMQRQMLYDANNDTELLRNEPRRKTYVTIIIRLDRPIRRVRIKFFANHNTVILDCGKVTFGDHVFIGPNCGFYTAGHPIDAEKEIKAWNMHIQLRWVTMSGLGPVYM